jgi:hypothetical protein
MNSYERIAPEKLEPHEELMVTCICGPYFNFAMYWTVQSPKSLFGTEIREE